MARPGTFKPGQSGNPGGKPKGYAELTALARQHTAAAIQVLFDALTDPRLKVHAAEALLDRGWGRPAQTQIHENADGSPISIVIATAIPIEAADHPVESVH